MAYSRNVERGKLLGICRAINDSVCPVRPLSGELRSKRSAVHAETVSVGFEEIAWLYSFRISCLYYNSQSHIGSLNVDTDLTLSVVVWSSIFHVSTVR